MAEQSLGQIIWHASFMVQLVLLILLTASIVSWSIIIHRHRQFKTLKKANAQFEQCFWSGQPLHDIWQQTRQLPGLAQVFHAGMQCIDDLKPCSLTISERLRAICQRQQVASERMLIPLEQNLAWLATIGSVSPYVGLFGTVWGILTTFRGFGNLQQTTLSQVAPGIAEALVATAVGLAVAIPAVIAYNRFRGRLDTIDQHTALFCDDLSALLEKEWRQAAVKEKTIDA